MKYKLKLRVYDVFYNLIHRYDPDVQNFNHRPFYCVTDGDRIYTLSKDLGSLAQKSEDDDYKVCVVFQTSRERSPTTSSSST